MRRVGLGLVLLIVACGTRDPSSAPASNEAVAVELFRGSLKDAVVRGDNVYVATGPAVGAAAVYRVDQNGAEQIDEFDGFHDLRWIADAQKPVVSAERLDPKTHTQVQELAVYSGDVDVSRFEVLPQASGLLTQDGLHFVDAGVFAAVRGDESSGGEDMLYFMAPGGASSVRKIQTNGGVLGSDASSVFWVDPQGNLMKLTPAADGSGTPAMVLALGADVQSPIFFDPSAIVIQTQAGTYRAFRLGGDTPGKRIDLALGPGTTVVGESRAQVYVDDPYIWWFESAGSSDDSFFWLARLDASTGDESRWSLGEGQKPGFVLATGGALYFTAGSTVLRVAGEAIDLLASHLLLPIGELHGSLIALDPEADATRLLQLH
jgi:hypothetical protein